MWVPVRSLRNHSAPGRCYRWRPVPSCGGGRTHTFTHTAEHSRAHMQTHTEAGWGGRWGGRGGPPWLLRSTTLPSLDQTPTDLRSACRDFDLAHYRDSHWFILSQTDRGGSVQGRHPPRWSCSLLLVLTAVHSSSNLTSHVLLKLFFCCCFFVFSESTQN